jgi:hypothetical protein
MQPSGRQPANLRRDGTLSETGSAPEYEATARRQSAGNAAGRSRLKHEDQRQRRVSRRIECRPSLDEVHDRSAETAKMANASLPSSPAAFQSPNFGGKRSSIKKPKATTIAGAFVVFSWPYRRLRALRLAMRGAPKSDHGIRRARAPISSSRGPAQAFDPRPPRSGPNLPDRLGG